MTSYDELQPGTELPVREVTAFLHKEGLTAPLGPLEATVAYHDACHALRVLKIHDAPRALLATIPAPQGGTSWSHMPRLAIAEVPVIARFPGWHGACKCTVEVLQRGSSSFDRRQECSGTHAQLLGCFRWVNPSRSTSYLSIW